MHTPNPPLATTTKSLADIVPIVVDTSKPPEFVGQYRLKSQKRRYWPVGQYFCTGSTLDFMDLSSGMWPSTDVPQCTRWTGAIILPMVDQKSLSLRAFKGVPRPQDATERPTWEDVPTQNLRQVSDYRWPRYQAACYPAIQHPTASAFPNPRSRHLNNDAHFKTSKPLYLTLLLSHGIATLWGITYWTQSHPHHLRTSSQVHVDIRRHTTNRGCPQRHVYPRDRAFRLLPAQPKPC
jgi:hypothetical protein